MLIAAGYWTWPHTRYSITYMTNRIGYIPEHIHSHSTTIKSAYRQFPENIDFYLVNECVQSLCPAPHFASITKHRRCNDTSRFIVPLAIPVLTPEPVVVPSCPKLAYHAYICSCTPVHDHRSLYQERELLRLSVAQWLLWSDYL